MAVYRRFMTHVTCRLTAKNCDQLRNHMLGILVWATFTFLITGTPYAFISYISSYLSVLWRCWLGGRKGIRLVKKTEWWGAGMVICLERGADLHMAQLMPLPLTVSCFSKIQIGYTFLVPAHPGRPGQRAIKRVCYWNTTVINVWMWLLHSTSRSSAPCSAGVQRNIHGVVGHDDVML